MVMFMGSSLLSMLAVLITAKQWIAAVEALGTPSINPSGDVIEQVRFASS